MQVPGGFLWALDGGSGEGNVSGEGAQHSWRWADKKRFAAGTEVRCTPRRRAEGGPGLGSLPPSPDWETPGGVISPNQVPGLPHGSKRSVCCGRNLSSQGGIGDRADTHPYRIKGHPPLLGAGEEYGSKKGGYGSKKMFPWHLPSFGRRANFGGGNTGCSDRGEKKLFL